MTELSFTRRRLEAIADDALRSAGVLGVLPTPLEALRAAADIRSVEPIEHLSPTAVRTRVPLLGAMWFEERTIFVDDRQSVARRRFTEAHELTHALCPWHKAMLLLDTEEELFRSVGLALEAEANAGAGLLIFQGREFARRIGAEPPSIARATELAREYGASLHATLHHLVEGHPLPTALLVVGRFRARDGTLPVWRTIQSPAFPARLGAVLPTAVPADGPFSDVVEAARAGGNAVAMLGDLDRTDRARRWRVEAHYNRHAFLVMVTSPAALSTVRAA